MNNDGIIRKARPAEPNAANYKPKLKLKRRKKVVLKPNKKFVIEVTNHGDDVYMARSKYTEWIGCGRTLEECLESIQSELEFLWDEYVEKEIVDDTDFGVVELKEFMLENFHKV